MEDSGTEPAAEDRADDTEKQSNEEPAALLARHDGLSDGACDEAENNPSDESHGPILHCRGSAVQ
ncbi:hypothetical protein HMPREF9205_2147 [Cutibacterium acnes SK182]|nr:hypothetical protein HMPREF9205_2147 [Cutibacterium acnes SK182]